MNKIAIFASGSGSNAENIVNYFNKGSQKVEFLFLTNNSNAFINERAHKLGVAIKVFTKDEFKNSNVVLQSLLDFECDLIVLAGFLLLVPENLVKSFPNKIINIHPALLPKYGGKGMYGSKIHRAVFDNKEKETGITIHYVDTNYDEGKIIRQEKLAVLESDTPESIEAKIHSLEYEYFPKVIEELL